MYRSTGKKVLPICGNSHNSPETVPQEPAPNPTKFPQVHAIIPTTFPQVPDRFPGKVSGYLR